ncbi:MAG: hypothetical protein ABW096_08655 [Candidatus Thiodiazotropha sp.]
MIKGHIDADDKAGLDKLLLLFVFIFGVTLLLLWLTERQSDDLSVDKSAQTIVDRHEVKDGMNKRSAATVTPDRKTIPKSSRIQGQDNSGNSAESAWSKRFQVTPARPLPGAKVVGDYTIAEHMKFKEEYYCDLAIQAREQCEGHPDEGTYKQCLSLRSYYTYSRHCGHQP